MTHSDAVKDQMVERYFLGELKDEQRDAFEEHYFECATCAEDVRLTAAFQANAKAVFSERERASVRAAVRGNGWSFWSWWSPAPAWITAGVLLCMTIWQSAIRIPGLERQVQFAQSARVVPAAVLRAETRGDLNAISLPRGASSLLLIFDVNDAPSTPTSTAELRSESGAAIFSQRIDTPAAGTSMHLLVPAAQLAPGSYTLTIRGENRDNNLPGETIGPYRFSLQRP